jgi:peptidoglycan lytic transglycosylase
MTAKPGRDGRRDRRSRSIVPGLVLGALVLTGCARHPPPVPEGPRNGVEIGTASWYGPDFHGRPTSSREIYNMNDMTAAHPTLPFGTYVLVTNLDNQRTAVVRVNDRGPFVGGRIIDLSYAAARVLDMVGPGTARVRLEVLKAYPAAGPEPAAVRWSVQVGAFAVQENAYAMKRKLEPRYPQVFIRTFQTPGRTYYRVRVGAKDKEAALETARRLADEGLAVLLVED